MAPHRIAALGIARTFQNIELFEHATLLQNLLLARHAHKKSGFFSELLFLPSVRRMELEHREAVEKAIDFLDLQQYRDSLIVNLPYGVRKVTELARALCTDPQLLLLDEPSSGLNVEETEDMAFWIQDIRNLLGITVLMVEHDMSLVSAVSDRVLALNYGRPIAMGTPAEVQAHPEVIRAYLGAEDDPLFILPRRGARRGGMTPSTSLHRIERGHDRPILKVTNIETYYGPIMAIRGVSFEVPQGGIVTILGANGAGKTTVLKTICGVMDPQKGSVAFEGSEIQRMDPDKVMRLGVSHVPEGREVFPFLSVRENLRMGAYTRRDADGVAQDLEAVFGYFPVLRERADQRAGSLSGGEQQMLAISRALMARPRLMLLDEPSLGLSPKLVKDIFDIVVRINRERGVTILLVEQNANMALQTADFGYVLEVGRIVMADTCARLMEKEDIKEFYLGIKEQGARGQRRWKKRKTWR